MNKAPSVTAAGTPADFKTRVQAVTEVAAQHAASVDRAARFPEEAFAAVKSQRLLGILVPQRLGGEGADLAQVADVCYQLAQACASTGMIYAMHQIKIGRLLRRLCAEQLLLASSTTEGQGGGNVRASEAPVEYRDGRISLERRASVISYGAYADGIVTTARRSSDAAASDQVLIAFLKDDYTLTRLQGWNTLGMRGTCSEGYTLKAAGAAERTLRGMLASSLRAYQRSMDDPKALASLEFQTMITLTKVEASELAVSIVLSAMRACGLSGYRCDSEFSIERHLRDVLSAPIMINNDRILTNLGSSSLLTPIAASIGD